VELTCDVQAFQSVVILAPFPLPARLGLLPSAWKYGISHHRNHGCGGVVCTLTRPTPSRIFACGYSSVYAGPAGNHRIEVVAEMIRYRLLPRLEGHVQLVWGPRQQNGPRAASYSAPTPVLLRRRGANHVLAVGWTASGYNIACYCSPVLGNEAEIGRRAFCARANARATQQREPRTPRWYHRWSGPRCVSGRRWCCLLPAPCHASRAWTLYGVRSVLERIGPSVP